MTKEESLAEEMARASLDAAEGALSDVRCLSADPLSDS